MALSLVQISGNYTQTFRLAAICQTSLPSLDLHATTWVCCLSLEMISWQCKQPLTCSTTAQLSYGYH